MAVVETARGARLAGPSAAAMLGSKWIQRKAARRADPRQSQTAVAAHRSRGRSARRRSPRRQGYRGHYCRSHRIRHRPSHRLRDRGSHAHRRGDEPGPRSISTRSARSPQRIAECPDSRDCGRCCRSSTVVPNPPQETIARLALTRVGLPKPHHSGRDLRRVRRSSWPASIWPTRSSEVAIEYDGEQHWADPKIRQADSSHKMYELNRLGWIVIRVSNDQLRYRRTTYTTRVEKALLERGMRW